MSTAMFLLATLLTLMGCGGGEVAPPPVPQADPGPAPPKYPFLVCPDDATFRESATTDGVEQICETTGVKNGPFRRWFTPELRAVDGNYKMGTADGAWVWWYPDGTKKSKGTYRSGKQAGSWTWWHENGTKIEEGDFLAGRKAGTWTRWYESETKKEEGMYHNGVKNGTWSYFRDDVENTVKRKETWQAGNKQESQFFAADGKTKIDEPLPEDVEAPEGSETDEEGGDDPANDEGQLDGTPDADQP